MGRKRLELDEKKVSVKLTIKKKYVDMLKEKNINMSQLFEEKVKELLKK